MFEGFKAWLRGGAATTTAVPATPEKEAMRVSPMALAEARGAYGAPLQPFSVPRRPQWLDANMAMDAVTPGLTDLYNWAAGGAMSEGLAFLGYPYLSELAQRPEYRRISEIYASEATRKWIKITTDDEDRKAAIEKALQRFDIKTRFREAAEHDGFFGRAQIFVDFGHQPNDAELAKGLPMKPQKVGVGTIKNFKVVEPFWSYPGPYNSTSPLAADYYQPKSWNIFGASVHSERLLTFVSREVPDILKPAYQFGGLSLSQMVKPYVDNWLRTRQSVSDLLHSFSTMVLATDLSTVLSGGGAQALIDRAQLFNQTRDNRGLMMLNKDSEELTSVSTPLTTLDALLSQSQEQMASVSGIPLVVLLGVTPSGLNASSDGEIRTFYAAVKAYQERLFRAPLQRVLEILQLDLDGTIDPEITFEFVDLWETSEVEKATIRKTNADIDVAYVGAGVVSNEEVRERLAEDEESPYYGVDLAPEAPDMPGDTLDEDEGLAQDGWITTENGSHLKLDDDGVVVGGAGGKLNGRKLGGAKAPKKEAKYSAAGGNPHNDAELDHVLSQKERYATLEKKRAELESSKDYDENKNMRIFSGSAYQKAANELGLHPQTQQAIAEHMSYLDETERKARERIKGGVIYPLAKPAMDETPLVGAGCLIVDNAGRVLLLKRSATAEKHPETWCLPGGKIEPGETPAQAAARETHEEVGYDVGTLGPSSFLCQFDGFHTYFHVVGKTFDPELDGEHTEAVWSFPNATPAPLHPGMKAIFDALAALSAQPLER